MPYPQLGFALQLKTPVRFLGTFLDDPLRVPKSVVAFAMELLGINNWSDLQKYQRNRVRFVHRQRIGKRYGYKDFSNPVAQRSLMQWLNA